MPAPQIRRTQPSGSSPPSTACLVSPLRGPEGKPWAPLIGILPVASDRNSVQRDLSEKANVLGHVVKRQVYWAAAPAGSRDSNHVVMIRPLSPSGLGFPLGWLHSRARCLPAVTETQPWAPSLSPPDPARAAGQPLIGPFGVTCPPRSQSERPRGWTAGLSPPGRTSTPGAGGWGGHCSVHTVAQCDGGVSPGGSKVDRGGHPEAEITDAPVVPCPRAGERV